MPDMNQKLDRFTAKILAEAADESKRALAEVKRRRELRLQEAEDAALKEARVEMKVFYGPPTETNFGGGLLTGTQASCRRACEAFGRAVCKVASDPVSF